MGKVNPTVLVKNINANQMNLREAKAINNQLFVLYIVIKIIPSHLLYNHLFRLYNVIKIIPS